MKPSLMVEYCPKCGWLPRAVWTAQELLITFSDELGQVVLKPSQTAGRFEVSIDGNSIFDRKTAGRFPEIKELKKLTRDLIAPLKNLGHSEH